MPDGLCCGVLGKATTCYASLLYVLVGKCPIYLTTNGLEEQWKTDQVFWSPATQTGDLNEVPDSRLQSGLALVIVTTWGMKPVDGKFLSFCFPPSLSVFQIKSINLS